MTNTQGRQPSAISTAAECHALCREVARLLTGGTAFGHRRAAQLSTENRQHAERLEALLNGTQREAA